MANDETTISLFGVNAPPPYRMVVEDDETVIKTYDTNTPMWKINRDIAGGAKAMTTAQRTAITPKEGELIFDTDLGVLFVGDGVTAGGTAVGGGGGGVVPGYRLSDDGVSLNFNPVTPIVDTTGSSTVTLNPDHAYKIVATGGAVTLNANVPASGYWGLEGHAEIFVSGTGYVVTGANVVLANALEPDSVNNCTVRFHDGMAIIAVEDHVAGYIVVNGSTAGEGSLAYGIDTSANEYIAFDATLNGTPIDLSGSTANGEKHIVGNGYTETTLTGNVNCGTSKFTVVNLSLQNVGITGGTMTLGDAYIPGGATVSVNGGGLAIEKCENDGAIQNVGSNFINIKNGALYGTGTVYPDKGNVRNTNGTASISGLVFSGGSSVNYGMQLLTSGGSAVTDVTGCTFSIGSSFSNRFGAAAVITNGTANYSRCLFTGNQTIGVAYAGCAAIAVLGGTATTANLLSCTVSGNTGNAVVLVGSGTLNASETDFEEAQTVNVLSGGTVTFAGSNTFRAALVNVYSAGTAGGDVVISSGAILDLTGNSNATPIAPGGGITFAPGGATVRLGAAAGTVDSSYMLDNVTLPAGAKLTNTAVVDLNGGQIRNNANQTYSMSGCMIMGGIGSNNLPVVDANLGSAVFTSVTFAGNTGLSNNGGAVRVMNYSEFHNCVFTDNVGFASKGTAIFTGKGEVLISGCTFGNKQDICKRTDSAGTFTITGNNTIYAIKKFDDASFGNVVISSGAVITLADSIGLGTNSIQVVGGTCTVNGNVISAGTYTSIDSTGTPT